MSVQPLSYKLPCKLLLDERTMTGKQIAIQYIVMFLAEAMGTGIFVLYGCASVGSGNYEGKWTLMQCSTVFGLAIGIALQIVMLTSHGSLNPSVSVCFWMLGVISLPMAINFVIAEIIGGYIGFLLLMTLAPKGMLLGEVPPEGFCMTVIAPEVEVWQAFLWEFFSTAILIMLVCNACDARNMTKKETLGLRFAVYILVLVVIVAPYTGCSMNIARSFGPALYAWKWDDQWLMFIGPITSTIFFTYVYHSLFMWKPAEDQIEV